MAQIIGIDLGTTRSAVAVADEHGISRVFDHDGSETIDSVVHWSGDAFEPGDGQTGAPENTFRGVKRLLGRKALSDEVVRLARSVPYRIAASPTGDCWVRADDRPTPPAQLAGAVLRALRTRAEDSLEHPITRAVIAVPAYFDDAQRQAVRDAGKIAGLEVVRLINEPTAAALAFGMSGRPQTIAVFDLGGGTFDVSILRAENDVFTVLASHGDDALGGDDWDRRILDLLIDELFSVHRFDATSKPSALAALRSAAEAAKIALTKSESTHIALVLPSEHGSEISLSRSLTRDEFENETGDLCDRLGPPCQLALRDAGITASELDEVLVVGGMTGAPMIQRAVRRLLGEPSTNQVDPITAVARGAAVCASILAGSDTRTTLLDVSSHSLGVVVCDVEIPDIISRGQELPARRSVRIEVADAIGDSLTIDLYRGERRALVENTSVGRVQLELGASDGPRQVELTVSIDVNSIVAIDARDVATGVRAQTRLRTRGALSENQLIPIVGADTSEASDVGN